MPDETEEIKRLREELAGFGRRKSDNIDAAVKYGVAIVIAVVSFFISQNFGAIYTMVSDVAVLKVRVEALEKRVDKLEK